MKQKQLQKENLEKVFEKDNIAKFEGKVKNVVVFMGKSLETNMDVLRNKIENDHQFIESAKKKVIEKLLTKVDIPDINSEAQNIRRYHRLDAIPEFNKTTESIVKIMRKRYDKLKSKETTIKRNDSDSLIVAFFDSMYKNVTKPLM